MINWWKDIPLGHGIAFQVVSQHFWLLKDLHRIIFVSSLLLSKEYISKAPTAKKLVWSETLEARGYLRRVLPKLDLLLLLHEVLKVQLELQDLGVGRGLAYLLNLLIVPLRSSLLHHLRAVFFNYFGLFKALPLFGKTSVHPFPSSWWLGGRTETLLNFLREREPVIKIFALDIQIHLCCPFFLQSVILRSILSGTLRGKDCVPQD